MSKNRFSDDPVSLVVRTLTSAEKLRQGGIDPLTILMAKTNYEHGHETKRNRIWKPVNDIQNALDKAFYKCMDVVGVTNKRYLIAVDISGALHRFSKYFLKILNLHKSHCNYIGINFNQF